jgi:hypothetical protein
VNPAVFGQSITLTATVIATGGEVGTPTGTVNFLDGVTTIGSGTLNASGQATFTTSGLSVGSHSITAAYAGDVGFGASTSAPVIQAVNPASTSTVVVSSANPSTLGQSVTFTATVSATAPGSGTPTGAVAFKDGASTIGTGTLAGGIATFATTSLSVGAHSIIAVYGGSGNYTGSTSVALSQTVNPAATSTVVVSSVNPSAFGQSVTFTATVTSSAGTPSGTVLFKDGATTLGAGTLDASGNASFTLSTLTAGSHAITASYGGSGNHAPSTSPVLT